MIAIIPSYLFDSWAPLSTFSVQDKQFPGRDVRLLCARIIGLSLAFYLSR